MSHTISFFIFHLLCHLLYLIIVHLLLRILYLSYSPSSMSQIILVEVIYCTVIYGPIRTVLSFTAQWGQFIGLYCHFATLASAEVNFAYCLDVFFQMYTWVLQGRRSMQLYCGPLIRKVLIIKVFHVSSSWLIVLLNEVESLTSTRDYLTSTQVSTRWVLTEWSSTHSSTQWVLKHSNRSLKIARSRSSVQWYTRLTFSDIFLIYNNIIYYVETACCC